jgi:hypothetical protein
MTGGCVTLACQAGTAPLKLESAGRVQAGAKFDTEIPRNGPEMLDRLAVGAFRGGTRRARLVTEPPNERLLAMDISGKTAIVCAFRSIVITDSV